MPEKKKDYEGLGFWRCHLCHRVVSPWDLAKHHACPACGCNKMQPTDLSIREGLKQVVLHPLVWKWRKMDAWGWQSDAI